MNWFSLDDFFIISIHDENSVWLVLFLFYQQGEEISLEGRILAVCDSYDAMVTDRVYKKGKSIQEALAELRSMAGQFYDAEIVEILAEVLGE